MGKVKEEILNNATTLYNHMEKALKMGIVKREEIKQYDEFLKSEFPHMGYDLSKLYKESE